jgi:hypothetical protein
LRIGDAHSTLAERGQPSYLWCMPDQKTNLGTIALVVALLAIFAAAAWYAASAWISISGPPMPAVGYVAMTFGVVISLVVGCGLMALLFYSSRHGYDEQHRADSERE